MDNNEFKKNYALAFVFIVTILVFVVGVPLLIYVLFKISEVAGIIAFIFVLALLYNIIDDELGN